MSTLNFEPHHPLQPYWNLAVAGVHADALDVALQVRLFDTVAAGTDARALAAALGWSETPTALLLELLWSMGLLERSVPHLPSQTQSATTLPTALPSTLPIYRTATIMAAYLHSGSAQFCGDALAYRLHSLRHFGSRLPAYLQARNQQAEDTQAPAAFQTADGSGWAEAARRQIGQEQRATTAAAALNIVRHIPEYAALFAATEHVQDAVPSLRLLDLGGGPGWVAIELARACPQLHGAVFDWPETVAVAGDNIAAAGLATRLQALPGDLVRDDIGSGYDLIWCSSVLHFVPDILHALQRMHTALATGGVLICAQAEIPEDAAAAAHVLPYYLPMRMLGRHVTKQGQLAQLLLQAGFTHVEQSLSHAFPMAPLQVLVARKTSE